MCMSTNIYVCTYLEPKWPLFLKVNPPKQGRNSNQNKGQLGSRYIHMICFFLCKQIGGFKVVVNIPKLLRLVILRRLRGIRNPKSLSQGRLRRWRFLWIMGKSRPGIIKRGPPIRTESWHGKINQAPKDWQVLSCPLVMFRVSTLFL